MHAQLHVLSLQAQESALTGESVPGLQDIVAVAVASPLGDRHCLLFAGQQEECMGGTCKALQGVDSSRVFECIKQGGMYERRNFESRVILVLSVQL